MAKAPEKKSAKSVPAPAPKRPVAIHPFGAKPLRTFALAIALPVLLLYIATATLTFLVIGFMATDFDRAANLRGFSVMHAAANSLLNDLSSTVSSEGTWDEAYLNVVVRNDPAWMDTTWGSNVRLGQSFDDVLVTDQAGAIVFGENAGGPLAGNIDNLFAAAPTMLKQLDTGIAATGDATTVSAFAADKQGTIAVAAVSVHQTTQGQTTVPRGTRRVLWVVRRVTPAVLQDLAARYLTPLPNLVSDPGDDLSSLDLTDADGHVVGTIAWRPDRPGGAAFNHSLVIAFGVFVGLGLALVLGLGVLRRAMMRRATAIEAALAVVVETAVEAAASAPIAAKAGGAARAEHEPVSRIDSVVAADFAIEYQPVFDLRAETLIGAEALLRWKALDNVELAQEALTPAENAILLERVGLLAIRRAADEVAPLLGMLLTVTVSAGQMSNPVFSEKIAGTLAAMNFPTRRLQLNLHTVEMTDPESLREPIETLRNLGVSIALADYALGATTLELARSGLVDRIRLPKFLTSGIDGDPMRYTLIEATVNVARELGLAVNVPGIARKEDAGRMLRAGCREFQGPIFAAPMSVAALTQLVLAPAQKKAS